MLSTPPTRRGRFMVGGNRAALNDDSPILSQETINISWKWNNESTPVRSTSKISKLRQRTIANASNISPVQELQNLQENLARLKKKQNFDDSPIGMKTAAQAAAGSSAASSSAVISAEPENNSPKGMYKFQEEMRKIQFDESDTSCDNFNDKSMTVADTGYPVNADRTNANYSDNLDIAMEHNNDDGDDDDGARNDVGVAVNQQQQQHFDASFANDLFNDSDFDQILLTCQIPAEKSTAKPKEAPTTTTTTTTNPTTATVKSTSSAALDGGSQLSVKNVSKKASSAPEIKTQNSDSCGSNWNLIVEDDDCFDDLMKDFDIPTDALNTSAKFTRHKSMPQPQPQAAPASKVSISTATATVTKMTPQQSNVHIQNNFNRKSFTRHESMPISNNSTTNRFSVASTSTTNTSHNSSVRPNSSKPIFIIVTSFVFLRL